MPFPQTAAIVPGVDDAPFWAAAREKRLVFQCCAACGTARHPPGPRCARCRSDAVRWVEAPARGELYSFTVAHTPPGEAWPERYVIALVLFRDLNDVRLVTNIVEPGPEALAVGMAVEAVWEPHGDGFVPRFRALPGGAA